MNDIKCCGVHGIYEFTAILVDVVWMMSANAYDPMYNVCYLIVLKCHGPSYKDLVHTYDSI